MAQRRVCPEKQLCSLVRSGNCPNSHPPCRHGVDCRNLKQRNCTFYHPRIHFAIIGATDDNNKQKENTNDEEGDNDKNALPKDDDSVINAIHFEPNRHNKPWQKWEDETLVKYINTSKNTIDPKYVTKFMKEFQRKEGSIRARIQKIKATKKNKKAQKTNHSETETENSETHENEGEDDEEEEDTETSSSDDDDDDDDDEQDKKIVDSAVNNRVQELMKTLDDLKCYYGKTKNKYEIRSIDYLIKDIKGATIKETNDLKEVVGCDIGYFRDKWNTMKQKYGAIDRETQAKAMQLLQNVKRLCENQIKSIENAVNHVTDNHWLGDKTEFVKITKHDLYYFERIQRAMKAPKQKINIKMEVENADKHSQKHRDKEPERGRSRSRGRSVDRVENVNNKAYNDRKRHREHHNNNHYSNHYPQSKRAKYVNTI